MVIDKIRKMSIKGVKLKSESFSSVSPGVLELWKKNLRGRFRPPPPGPDRVKGHAKSYDIEFQDNLNPLNHFTKTKALVESHLENLLKDMKGFKFNETLEVTFEKDTIDSKTGKRVSIYKTAFFNGKVKTITKPNDIEPRTKHV